MVTAGPTRTYLSGPERRAEIVTAAAQIGVDEGLERITLRRVAKTIDVRPGLISHYFPEAESLVAAAFVQATDAERDAFFNHEPGSTPMARVALFLHRAFSPDSVELSRLWLNARNLSRYNSALRHALGEQEAANRTELTEIIRVGIETGEFHCQRPERSAILILILVDALTAYANEERTEASPLVAPIVYATAERELGLEPGALAGHPDPGGPPR